MRGTIVVFFEMSRVAVFERDCTVQELVDTKGFGAMRRDFLGPWRVCKLEVCSRPEP